MCLMAAGADHSWGSKVKTAEPSVFTGPLGQSKTNLPVTTKSHILGRLPVPSSPRGSEVPEAFPGIWEEEIFPGMPG